MITTTTTKTHRTSLTIINNNEIKKEFSLNDLFLEPLNEEYQCSICYDSLIDYELTKDGEIILKADCLTCREGHYACNDCWKKQLDNKNECMICRVKIESFQILSKNIFLKNKLLKKKIFCPNILKYINKNKLESLKNNKLKENEELIGCKSILIVEELNFHLKECKFYNNLEIGNNGMEMNNYIECEKCNNKIEILFYRTHEQKYCPKQLIECKYKLGGCNDQIQRDQLSDHLKSIDHSEYIDNIIIQYRELFNNQKEENEIIKQKLKDTQLSLDQLREELIQIKPTLSFKYKNDWIIHNYQTTVLNQSKSNNNRYLNSPEFQVGPVKFILQLFPQGNLAMNSNYLSLYLTRINNLSTETNLKFSFVLLNFDSTKNYKRGSNITVTFDSQKIRAGFPQFIPNKISKDSGFIEDSLKEATLKYNSGQTIESVNKELGPTPAIADPNYQHRVDEITSRVLTKCASPSINNRYLDQLYSNSPPITTTTTTKTVPTAPASPPHNCYCSIENIFNYMIKEITSNFSDADDILNQISQLKEKHNNAKEFVELIDKRDRNHYFCYQLSPIKIKKKN